MYNLWIIDSKPDRHNMYKECINLSPFCKQIQTRKFTSLELAHKFAGYADFILIDCGALQCGKFHDHFFDFFYTHNTGAVFGIQSAVGRWALREIQELRDNFKNRDILLDYVDIDGKSVMLWLAKWINLYERGKIDNLQ